MLKDEMFSLEWFKETIKQKWVYLRKKQLTALEIGNVPREIFFNNKLTKYWEKNSTEIRFNEFYTKTEDPNATQIHTNIKNVKENSRHSLRSSIIDLLDGLEREKCLKSVHWKVFSSVNKIFFKIHIWIHCIKL